MNIRSFMVLVASVTVSVSACVVVPGTGGSGTNGVGGGSDVGGVGGGGGGVDGVGGAGGGGEVQCDPDVHCGTAITDPGPTSSPTLICDDSESATAYDAWFACICAEGSACGAACADGACAFKTTQACTDCVKASCTAQQEACANDI